MDEKPLKAITSQYVVLKTAKHLDLLLNFPDGRLVLKVCSSILQALFYCSHENLFDNLSVPFPLCVSE